MNAYRLKGRQATNKYTFEISPGVGSGSWIVSPDQPTSTLRPAL